MRIWELAIKRPVFTIMLLAFFVVMGLASLSRLGLDLMPDINLPMVTVTTVYPGASPDVISSQVTKVLEDEIGTIEGIENLTSTSTEGMSIIMVEFSLGRNADLAAQDVRAKVSLARPRLPDGVEEPVVQKADIRAIPILIYSIKSDTMNDLELYEYADKKIRPFIEQSEGVGSVQIFGGREREIRVVLDPSRLEALNLSPITVGNSLLATNVNIPSGKIKQGELEYLLKVPSEFASISEIGNTIVGKRNGIPIRLSEVAQILDTGAEPRSYVRLNGEKAVGVIITKRADANTVTTADRVKQRMKTLQREIPPSMEISQISDTSVFIRDSINEIKINIIYGALLASLVVWLFVGRLSFTIAISMSILVSISAALSLIDFAGFTLNVMSMMGMAVAVGLVVDDAIVVQENIIRLYEETKDAFVSALRGASTVALAVLAATSTIVAVFIPIAFMRGIIGQFFRQFGLTVAFAVAFSILTAFTLIPLVFYRVAAYASKESRGVLLDGGGEAKSLGHLLSSVNAFFSRMFIPIHLRFIKGYERVERSYLYILRWALSHRLLTIAIAGIFVLSWFPLLSLLDKGFFPPLDQGEVAIYVELPPDAPLERTLAKFEEIEEKVKSLSDIELTFYSAGRVWGGFVFGGTPEQSNIGVMQLKMVPKGERSGYWYMWGPIPVYNRVSSFDLVEEARKVVSEVPGAKITVVAGGLHGGGGAQHPVQLSFTDPDPTRLVEVAGKAKEILASIPGVANADWTQRPGKLELAINPDLERMSQLRMDPSATGYALRILYEGVQFGSYREKGEEYDIRLIYPESARRDISSIKAIKLYSPELKRNVSLDTISTISLLRGASSIQHRDRIQSIDVFSDLEKGYGAGDVLRKWRSLLKKQEVIPETTKVTAVGESRRFGEMIQEFTKALILGIIFTYMVLASQFNSFKHPFTIMMSVPLSSTGALLLLYLTGKGFNLMSFLGIVMLVGLVTKNAILLVDFANQARERGLGVKEALLDAGLKRLRPIIMTTLTTIAGLLPVAFGLGEGADFRSPLAISVIGGLIFSTLLTLVLVPVIYTLVEGLRRKTGTARMQTQPTAQ